MTTGMLPPVLYLGHERLKRIRITPLPPKMVVYERHGEYHQWAQGGCNECPFHVHPSLGVYNYGMPMDCGFNLPSEVQPYSIRSFLIQLSLRSDFPCKYFIRSVQRDDFGNVCWDDGCMESCGGTDFQVYMHPCNVANGWMHGEEFCNGWEYIQSLCQTKDESQFLFYYLRTNRDREHPMPLPQAYIDATEHIRPDFLMFVPRGDREPKYKKLAIEIENTERYLRGLRAETERTAAITNEGYEIVKVSATRKMIDQARDLYRRITEIMGSPPERF